MFFCNLLLNKKVVQTLQPDVILASCTMTLRTRTRRQLILPNTSFHCPPSQAAPRSPLNLRFIISPTHNSSSWLATLALVQLRLRVPRSIAMLTCSIFHRPPTSRVLHMMHSTRLSLVPVCFSLRYLWLLALILDRWGSEFRHHTSHLLQFHRFQHQRSIEQIRRTQWWRARQRFVE
jgi:hypothetical protein